MVKLKESDIQEAIHLMNSENNEWFINELQGSISTTLSKARGDQSGKIESSIPLTEIEKFKLQVFLEKLFKRKIILSFTVLPSLLGGLKITVGDWKLDGSLNTQLYKLLQALGGAV